MGRRKKDIKENKLEEELSKLVLKIMDNYENKLVKDDFKEIASELIPQIDEIISRKIKEHFKELANYIIKKL